MGEKNEWERCSRCRSSYHSLLAHTGKRAAKDVQSARDDDHGRDLGAVKVRAYATWAAGILVHLQVVSPDVCQHWNFHGQRQEAESNARGTVVGGAVQEIVRGQADAGVASSWLGNTLLLNLSHRPATDWAIDAKFDNALATSHERLRESAM